MRIVSEVPSAFGSFCIFEEILVDYKVPFPTDEVDNSCISMQYVVLYNIVNC